MFSTPEFKVGALVVLVSGLIGVMSVKVSEGPGIFSRARTYTFDVPDAGGLVPNSAVKAAGIKIGVIDDIEYVNGQARIRVLIEGDLVMHTSGSAELKSDGILGDRHVQLNPGNPSDPEIENGGHIASVSDKGSIQALMKEFSNISGSISKLADTINKATGEGNDRSTSLGRIVDNIEKLTGDLAEISGTNKKKINEIVDQLHSITAQVDDFIGDDSPEGFKAGWEKVTGSLHRIESTLKNVDEIAAKVNRGEGTIGRLINDEETVDKINETLTGVNDFVGGVSSMETSVDFHSEFLASESITKSYLSLKIQPGLDRFYEIGIVDDPRGVESRTRTVTTGTTTGDVEETKTFERVKFTVLFAKNFYNLTVKGGLIESSGGIGIDYYALGRDLRFSVEVFDFEDSALRAFARYNVFKGLYLVAGGDNLSNSDMASAFIGAGIFVTNDDLRLLTSGLNF